MTWLAILALALVAFIGWMRTSGLERQLEELKRRLTDRAATDPIPSAKVAAITPAMRAAALAAVDAALAQPLQPPSAREPVAAAVATPAKPTPPPAPGPSVPRQPAFTRAQFETWLSEQGLAWIGGSALVIGGAFLVGYAAQRGFFTPIMRVTAAALLGSIMLAAGELVRGARLGGFGANKMVAAVLSGAGAAVLYADVWAAHQLYGFIGGGVAGGLLAAIAIGLLALSFLHGEQLAVLALAGAFAAPLIAGADKWDLATLSLYLGILIAAGAAIGWLRRWTWAAWTNIAGAAVWSLLAATQASEMKCLLVGIEPLAVTAALAFALPREPRRAIGPAVVIVAAFAALFAELVAAGHNRMVPIGVIAALVVPLGAAALQRKGQVPAWSLVAPGVAFTLAAAFMRGQGDPSLATTWVWCLQIVALNAASLWAGWRDETRETTAVGAISSAVLAAIAGAGLGDQAIASLGPLVACAALALGALRLATDRSRPQDIVALNLWSGASAASLLVAVAVGLTWRWQAIGFAGATLSLAAIAWRLKWRAVAIAASVAACLGLATLLQLDLLHDALGSAAGAWWMLGAATLVAVASFAGARLVKHETGAAEALRTLSPLAALTGAFVFLHWFAGGPGVASLDGLTEASIRTFLIADAGLASLVRLGAETTSFARWRGHLIMLGAAAHGLFFQAFLYNPRFALLGPDTAYGIIFLNTLAAAYLAPALVFGLAALRIYRGDQSFGRTYAVIAVLSFVLWAFLEIRRFCHGPHLSGDWDTIGAGEALACSLVLLVIAALAARARPRDAETAHPLHGDVAASLTVARVVAGGFAVWFAAWWSNPCWGPAAAPLANWTDFAAVFAGYGLITVLIARLALDARDADKPREADIGILATMMFGVVLASLGVRAAFHGLNLVGSSGAGEIENWSYSAVWALIGLALIGVSRTGGRLFLRAGLALLLLTTAKVFVLDTANLSGVVRAASFLALGVLLVLGALTARRIAQAAPRPGDAASAPDG